MARRAAFLSTFETMDTTSVILVDCGDVIGNKSSQERLKAQYLYEAYDILGVEVMNMGFSDLLLGQDFLLNMRDDHGLPMISANVYYADLGRRFLPPYIIKRIGGKKFLGLEWGGLKIGIFGVVQPLDELAPLPWDREKDEHRLIMREPATACREMVEELRPKVDLIVCLAHTGWLNARALARNVTGIDVMIVGNGSNVKPKPYMVNNIPLVMPGDQGKFLGILDLHLDEQKRVVEVDGWAKELDKSIDDDPVMAELVERYKAELQGAGEEMLAPASSQLNVVKFLGADACAECHPGEYVDWRKTAHAHATETLEKEGQQNNPDCVKCHVTGYGFFNGFHSYETTPDMIGVQCESCHGSASDHVKFARGEAIRETDRDPELSYLFEVSEERCVGCHDSEQDPDFEWLADREKVDHKP